MGCGGEGVVGGLTHIDVIVGVNLNTSLCTQRSDHFVGVHVGGGAGTGLEHVDREFSIVLALSDSLSSGDDGIGLFCGKQATVLVDLCAGGLQQAHSADLCGL